MGPYSAVNVTGSGTSAQRSLWGAAPGILRSRLNPSPRMLFYIVSGPTRGSQSSRAQTGQNKLNSPVHQECLPLAALRSSTCRTGARGRMLGLGVKESSDRCMDTDVVPIKAYNGILLSH